jgi:hypothetical protein
VKQRNLILFDKFKLPLNEEFEGGRHEKKESEMGMNKRKAE